MKDIKIVDGYILNAIDLDEVEKQLMEFNWRDKSTKPRVKILILDCCAHLLPGWRGMFLKIEHLRTTRNAKEMCCISMSTETSALELKNGGYLTNAILKHIHTPDLPLPQLFQKTRKELEKFFLADGTIMVPVTQSTLANFGDWSFVQSPAGAGGSDQKIDQVDQDCDQHSLVHLKGRKVLLKIILQGDSGVGKTSLIKRFATGKFTPSDKSTISLDYLQKEVNIDGVLVRMEIWDTAGQGKHSMPSIPQMLY